MPSTGLLNSVLSISLFAVPVSLCAQAPAAAPPSDQASWNTITSDYAADHTKITLTTLSNPSHFVRCLVVDATSSTLTCAHYRHDRTYRKEEIATIAFGGRHSPYFFSAELGAVTAISVACLVLSPTWGGILGAALVTAVVIEIAHNHDTVIVYVHP